MKLFTIYSVTTIIGARSAIGTNIDVVPGAPYDTLATTTWATDSRIIEDVHIMKTSSFTSGSTNSNSDIGTMAPATTSNTTSIKNIDEDDFSSILHVYKDFLTNAEMAQIRRRTQFKCMPEDKSDQEARCITKYYEPSYVSNSFAARLQRVTQDLFIENDKDTPTDSIMTTKIVKTTDKHQDGYVNEYSKNKYCSASANREHIGFVFLNDNKDASFVHGTSIVQVVAGTLVTFKGSVHHNTVINSGYVHIAGPFALRKSLDCVASDSQSGKKDGKKSKGGRTLQENRALWMLKKFKRETKSKLKRKVD